ncbi:MAG: hypothetical protein Kow00121_36980 [Elainellaceae cyanobacterium]
MKDSHQGAYSNAQIADFYHGWFIEIVAVGDSFGSVCYSPYREKFTDCIVYPSDLEAMSAAKRSINSYFACYTLAQTVREFYESKKLSFEEWQSLQQSLTQASKLPNVGR